MSAPILLPNKRLPGTPVAEFLARKPVRSLLQMMALGEMMADKLPSIPDRIEPGPLVGRVFLGGAAGGVCARIQGESGALGAVAGGVAAAVGAFTGYCVRRALVRAVGLPDLPVALCEDAVALLLAWRSLRP